MSTKRSVTIIACVTIVAVVLTLMHSEVWRGVTLERKILPQPIYRPIIIISNATANSTTKATANSTTKAFANNTIKATANSTTSSATATQNSTIKVIYTINGNKRNKPFFHFYGEDAFNFDGCEYTNCVVKHSENPHDAHGADLVLVYFNAGSDKSKERMSQIRQAHVEAQKLPSSSVWLINGHEAPSWIAHQWKDFFNTFDGAVSYGRNSLVYRPYGMAFQKENNSQTLERIHYSAFNAKGCVLKASHYSLYYSILLIHQFSFYI